MIRNGYALIFISMLVFGSMTLADCQFFYLEQEEVVEGREVGSEEVKDGEKGKNKTWLLINGSPGCLSFHHDHQFQHFFYFLITNNSRYLISALDEGTPLFILFCCLKVHFR